MRNACAGAHAPENIGKLAPLGHFCLLGKCTKASAQTSRASVCAPVRTDFLCFLQGRSTGGRLVWAAPARNADQTNNLHFVHICKAFLAVSKQAVHGVLATRQRACSIKTPSGRGGSSADERVYGHHSPIFSPRWGTFCAFAQKNSLSPLTFLAKACIIKKNTPERGKKRP